MTAQNQHYVPKFILRQFLCDGAREQVWVYDKHDDKSFRTSIRNVMAERQFNDFDFGEEFIVSFEPIAGRVEDLILPLTATSSVAHMAAGPPLPDNSPKAAQLRDWLPAAKVNSMLGASRTTDTSAKWTCRCPPPVTRAYIR